MSQHSFARAVIVQRDRDGLENVSEFSNVAYKAELWEMAYWAWCSNVELGYGIRTRFWPWAIHPEVAVNGNDNRVRHGLMTAEDNPYSYPTSPSYNTSIAPTEVADYGRMRWFNNNTWGRTQGDWPSVLGGICLLHGFRSVSGIDGCAQGNLFSHIDLGMTQIGVPYQHPVATTTMTTVAGQAWVTLNGYAWYYVFHQYLYALIRIESGPDRGVYIAQHWDRYTGRTNSYTPSNHMFLKNLDGTSFVPTGTGTYTISLSHSRAFFNETGVIPNSTGQAFLDGKYVAGESRNSYIFRIHYEKSGSPSPANEAQRGSYWISKKAYLYGNGNTSIDASAEDDGGPFSQRICATSRNTGNSFFYNTSAVHGLASTACIASVFDRAKQRMWFSVMDVNTGNGSIGYWNYKSTETYREVITSVGSPGCPLPVPFQLSTGANVRSMEMGSDGTLYAAVWHGSDATKGGYLAIKSDLSWQWFTAASIGQGAGNGLWIPLDRSRARTGTVGDVTTTAAGHVQSASAAFTAADIGRCIKLTGLPYDAGTWLISEVNSATDVTVTQLNGGAVVFTGESGGTFQIGDRIYIINNMESVWNAGKVSWTDTLAFGLRFSKAVAMTNGAQSAWHRTSMGQNAAVDQKTGRFFWYSIDGTKALNMYDPLTQTVTQRTLAEFATQVPGSSGSLSAPSTVWTMAVNPNPYFRELWVSTDTGHIRLNIDNFTAQYSRWALRETSSYKEGGLFHNNAVVGDAGSGFAGSGYYGNDVAYQYKFLPDGQVFAMHATDGSTASYYCQLFHFAREADNWAACSPPYQDVYRSGHFPSVTTYRPAGTHPIIEFDPYGGMIHIAPALKNYSSANYPVLYIGHPGATNYQWIDGAWVAKEVVRGPLPGSSSPGLSAKPLHTALEDLIMGVKVRFVSSGATGGENGEFLGRTAQIGVGRADGSTTAASASFVCSGLASLNFQSSDLGRYYIQIESGADQGTYKITSVTGDMLATLQKLDGTPFSATATAGTLQYSLWDIQSGTAVGPECTSFLANVGYGKDNTQDFGGIYVDMFGAKTVQSEQEEDYKFCVDVLPPNGSAGITTQKEAFWYDYWASAWAHRAFVGTTTYNDIFDGGTTRRMDGSNGKVSGVAASTKWTGGVLSALNGIQLSIDLGTDVEIGSVIVRMHTDYTSASYPYSIFTCPPTGNVHGIIGMLLRGNDADGAPISSTNGTIRCSGANISGTTDNKTVTTTGDFYGTVTAVTGTDGQTSPLSLGANVFQATAGKFSQSNVGMALRITTGSDVGYYRILTVSADGSQVTIRNLDQTAKTWSASASGLSYSVYDSVTEEDILFIPSRAAASTVLIVEYISNDGKSASVRIGPGATVTNQAWQCGKPTWKIVKRLASGAISVPPHVSNNGTYVSMDGLEALGTYAMLAGSNNITCTQDAKAVFDLTDLPASSRTGRYWRFGMHGAGSTTVHSNWAWIDAMEFYDTNGKRLFVHKYHMPDTYYSQPNFFANFYGRVDFIQANNTSCQQYAGTNGLATVTSTVSGGTVITLENGNRFLGWQVRPRGGTGSAVAGSNTFNITASDPPFSQSADVGRILYVQSGPNAGYYRITAVPSATSVTVAAPSGSGVTLLQDSGGTTAFSVHEGFNFGSSAPDYFVCTTGGNKPGLEHWALGSISDDLKSLTLYTNAWVNLAGQTWEIRRRGLENRRTSQGVDSAYTSRLLFAEYSYPAQSGDVSQDTKGYVKYFAGDIGGTSLTAGVAIGGTSHFQAASNNVFTQDDVGRILLITSGVNKGPYRIAEAYSSAEVILVDHYTGLPANLTADSSISYKIMGERRIRMSRYVTSLRS